MALVRWRCATGDERVLACTRVYSRVLASPARMSTIVDIGL